MKIPPLVHVRAARSSLPPASGGRDDVSARTMSSAALRRDLVAGALPRETEVLFPGLPDWTPAHEVPELWQAPAPEEAAAAEAEEARPSIPVSSAAAGQQTKKGFGAGAVIGGVAGAVGLLALGAAAIYFVYFHYKPVAVQHLPTKCQVAARVDLLDWAFFDPLSKKLAPAIDHALSPPPPPGPQPPSGPNLKERLKATAGIDIDRGAVREVATCVFQDKSLPEGKDTLLGYRAVIAIGGRFKTGSIPKIYEAAQVELHPLSARLEGEGESAVIRVPASSSTGGVAFVIGQAEDGTILVAPNDKALSDAREQKGEEEARANTGLRQKGALEIALDSVVFKSLVYLPGLPKKLEPVLAPFHDVSQGWIGIETGKSPRIDVSLEHKADGAAKDVEKATRELIELARKELESSPKDWAGEHAAIGSARVTREDTRVDLRVDFRYNDVDRGAGELGAQLEDPASPFRTKTLPKVGIVLPGTTPAPPAPSTSAPSPGPKNDKDDE